MAGPSAVVCGDFFFCICGFLDRTHFPAIDMDAVAAAAAALSSSHLIFFFSWSVGLSPQHYQHVLAFWPEPTTF